MSRCFPFPPPGYQKKLRVEDVTLIAKEKDKPVKEKRHKKDKEKGRKDGREKSKERHKEKDKEKHKHKEKEKKTGKKRSRDEKNAQGDISKVEKVGSNSPQSSCAQELERRINFVDGATVNQSVDTVYDRDQGKAVHLVEVAKSGPHQMTNGPLNNFQPKLTKIVFSNGAEQRTVRNGQHMLNNINDSIHGNDIQKRHDSSSKGDEGKSRKNGKRHKGEAEMSILETIGYNGAQVNIPREPDFVHELEKRVRDVNGATGHSYELSKDDGRNRPRTEKSMKQESANVVKISGIGQNGGDSTCNNKPAKSPLWATKPFISVKANGVVGVQGPSFGPTKPSSSIRNVNGMTRSQESHMGSTKPPSTIEKVNGTTSAHVPSHVTTKASLQMKSPEKVDCQESAKPPLTPRKVNLSVGPHGSPPIIPKAMPPMREVPETVGYHESAKPPLTPGKIDGTLVSRGPPPVTNKPPSTSRKERRKEKSSSKPVPHPDTKYLSQILSVPKMQELSDFDDSEWLFKSKSGSEHNLGYCRDVEERVWAKAVHIESVDVYALPYVIPY